MVDDYSSLVNVFPVFTKFESKKYRNCKSEDELDDEIRNTCSSSSGVVIFNSDGMGEVITQESFEDSALHFVFTKTTCIREMNDCDALGVGSVVQIYWSRSFERIVRGSHIVVHIEKIDVYKCSSFWKEDIFITFNSTSGTAFAVSEKNIGVAFHPNCTPAVQYETMRAVNEGRTEFRLSCQFKLRENTNRMIRAVLAPAPFKVEIDGNIDKIPYIVLKKYDELPGFEGIAVITKVVKSFFIEAIFLATSETVFFNSNACHSNVLDKVTTGSLISILASPTFSSSCFKWYGYDVTMLNSILPIKSLRMDGEYFFKALNTDCLSVDGNTLPRYDFTSSKRRSKHSERTNRCKENRVNFSTLDLTCSQFKYGHILFDRCLRFGHLRKNVYFNIQPYTRKFDILEYDINKHHLRASPFICNQIKQALEPLGLVNNQVTRLGEENPNSSEEQKSTTDTEIGESQTERRQKLCRKFGALMDENGFALNQCVHAKFILPDTAWKISERRFIGLHDDVQWVLMATFCHFVNKTSNTLEEEHSSNLLGGWWYRRTVPREATIFVVKEMNASRNIIEDCGAKFA